MCIRDRSNTAEKQKVVTLGDKILLFAQNNEIYSTAIPAGSPTDRLNYGQKWDKETTGKLPDGADVTSIIRFVDKLYLLAENKEVYNSNDGLTWTKDEVLNSDGVSVTNLITSFSDSDGSNHKKINGIAGIVAVSYTHLSRTSRFTSSTLKINRYLSSSRICSFTLISFMI